MSNRSHYDEIRAAQAGPLALAIYSATKNIVVFKNVSGAREDAVNWSATMAARELVAVKVRQEFAAKAQEVPSEPKPSVDITSSEPAQPQTTPEWLKVWAKKSDSGGDQ